MEGMSEEDFIIQKLNISGTKKIFVFVDNSIINLLKVFVGVGLINFISFQKCLINIYFHHI